METVLSINNLSKSYGKVRAVNNLSFNIEKGSVFGLLGPNGSGKTTTLGMILDVINSDSGSFKWFNKESGSEMRIKIGAVLENPNFYPYMSAEKNLKVVADIKNISYDNIENVLKRVDLLHRKNHKFKTYSYGMKQRLAIAAALLCDPEILILDEPTNGLDPQGIAEIRDLIIGIANEGRTIILASHLLDEVQKVCTHLAVLKTGNLLFAGKVDEVLAGGESFEICSDNMENLEKTASTHPEIKSVKKENGILVISFKKDISSSDINEYFFKKNICLSHLTKRKGSLEKQFLNMLSKS